MRSIILGAAIAFAGLIPSDAAPMRETPPATRAEAGAAQTAQSWRRHWLNRRRPRCHRMATSAWRPCGPA